MVWEDRAHKGFLHGFGLLPSSAGTEVWKRCFVRQIPHDVDMTCDAPRCENPAKARVPRRRLDQLHLLSDAAQAFLGLGQCGGELGSPAGQTCERT